jgi:hypothetical protein
VSRAALFLTLALVATGCGRQDDPAPAARDAEQREATEGVSPEELRERAQPMTPEEARELGVVDTTIHVADEP